MALRAFTAAVVVSLVVAAAPPIAGRVAPVRSVNRCTACHRAGTADHLRDWDLSVHARSGVSCSSCHAGDESQASAELAHAGLQMLSGHGAASTRGVLDGCGRCHAGVDAVFRMSAHFRHTAANRTAVPTCIDCHTAAGGNVLAADVIPRRCRTCHSEEMGLRATELLRLLRRLVLARTIVQERLLELERGGVQVAAERAALAEIEPVLTGVADGWHRFDLGPVEQTSRLALDRLDTVYDALEEAR